MSEHGVERMKLVAVSVGRPRELDSRDERIRTSIFKTPVRGPVAVHRLNVAGDEQSNLSVHGGLQKAVYAYPVEHYAFWCRELALDALPFGAFGENFTVEGLLEPDVWIGDAYRVGTTELVVTQPRMPCSNLNHRFDRADMVRRFQASGRTGFYLSVGREGIVEAGDAIVRVARDDRDLSIAEAASLYTEPSPDPSRLGRAADHPGLAKGWREHFRRKLERS